MRQRFSVRQIAVAVIVALGLSATPLVAQQFSGTVRGRVQDSSGAVVPAADVTIILVATNETQVVTTDGDGAYVAPNLKPGTYRITVAKPGFKSAAIADVKVDVQQSRSVNVTLELGQATEVVTVSGRAATVETTSSTVSQTIENKRLVDLPLNGRNPFSLATLAPGVAPAPGSSPFISGGRNATSEVTIDGVSNVNAENNVSILDLNYTPSVDAVQEFSVQTNAVSAEFGRLGGGVINLVTKSGSNTFHATAFGFGRNGKMDATNFFTNRAGQKPGSFKRNQFGGNVGGPVFTNKTFFFANYEGLRQKSGAVSTLTVPLQEWRNGDFSNLRNSNGQPIIIYDPATTQARSQQPWLVHSRSIPGQHHPVEPHQRRWSRPDAGPAVAQYGAVERVHPGEQLRVVGRATQQRRPRGLPCRSRHQRQVAHVCPLLVLGRRQPGLQQLPERRELVGRRWTDVTRGRRASRSTTTTWSRRHSWSTCATA